jgi:hypothetical protein
VNEGKNKRKIICQKYPLMTSYPESLTAKKIDEDEFYAIKIYHISS